MVEEELSGEKPKGDVIQLRLKRSTAALIHEKGKFDETYDDVIQRFINNGLHNYRFSVNKFETSGFCAECHDLKFCDAFFSVCKPCYEKFKCFSANDRIDFSKEKKKCEKCLYYGYVCELTGVCAWCYARHGSLDE